jgi:hypothetical protein
MGATIHAQKNCQTTEGALPTVRSCAVHCILKRCEEAYHSQPLAVSRTRSAFVSPLTSVPGMPHELCHFLDITYVKTVTRI